MALSLCRLGNNVSRYTAMQYCNAMAATRCLYYSGCALVFVVWFVPHWDNSTVVATYWKFGIIHGTMAFVILSMVQ